MQLTTCNLQPLQMKTIFLFLFIGIIQFAQAQAVPQVCARILLGLGQDSVTWQATPCAGFGGYVVLGQENNVGSFIILDTVFAPNIVHSNPNETPWNYQVGMLCGGVLTNLSLIVSNQRPVTPNLLSVSIVNNQPVISWNPSISPEVIGYQIYKEIPYGSGNFFPYPNSTTIIYGTNYTDILATDLLGRYAIVAVSRCNKSLLGLGNSIDGTTGPHTSMIVQGSIDTCNQKINLNWNHYENWEDGVGEYVILLSRNGGAFTPYDTVPKSRNSFVYTDAQDNDFLVFQIKAVEKNQNNSARSNNLTFDVRVNRPMDYLYLTNVSVNLNDEIEISWEWDIDVDFKNGKLLNGLEANALDTRLTFPVIGSAVNNFTDAQVQPQENSYFYKIETTDACGHIVRSNIAKTIFLEVEALEGFKNKISWSAAYIERGIVEEYWVYKIINGSPQRIAIVGTTDLTYIDELDIYNEAEAQTCYFVIANIRILFPDNKTYFSQSQSNKACAIQGSNIHIPNAIAPDGENRLFRPIIVFNRSIHNYSMLIFDRYGQQIFESKDLYDAWDGTHNGETLKTGVYAYFIRFQAPNGEIIERRGTVTLVR